MSTNPRLTIAVILGLGVMCSCARQPQEGKAVAPPVASTAPAPLKHVTVSGRLLTPEGAPIADVTVVLVPLLKQGDKVELHSLYDPSGSSIGPTGTTNDRGDFTIRVDNDFVETSQKLLQALKPGSEAGWFTLAVRKAGSELSPVRRGKGALALTIDLTAPEIAVGDVTR